MSRLRTCDVNWNKVYDAADHLLRTYNIPHRVSRNQREIYRNKPICFLVLPYTWDSSILKDIRNIPGVEEWSSFNTKNGRYRRFAIFFQGLY